MNNVINSNLLMFIIIAIMFVLILICLILAIINSSRISSYLDYTDDGDLMAAIKDYYDKVDSLAQTISNSENAVVNNRLTACESAVREGFSKTAVVNFDAFDDVSGNMSFALTVLDSYNNGFILTSLYGHNTCNTYVRKVENGETAIKLIDEERLSLQKAIKKD